jgi:hypothetical protein
MTAIYNQPLFGAMQADPYSPIQDDPTKPLMIRGYIYCEQNVEFPVGVSGIPAGWIRKSL